MPNWCWMHCLLLIEYSTYVGHFLHKTSLFRPCPSLVTNICSQNSCCTACHCRVFYFQHCCNWFCVYNVWCAGLCWTSCVYRKLFEHNATNARQRSSHAFQIDLMLSASWCFLTYAVWLYSEYWIMYINNYHIVSIITEVDYHGVVLLFMVIR